ncbi:heterokaryon incompatibility protein-domain-containing protein [Xylariomycetidae sp. FL0641]|nr:heterokaryon incompatibility protein-domain-containing protein [Xylariomycetidae sp. FL0641]
MPTRTSTYPAPYKPLNPQKQEIRLLKLRPGGGDDPIEGTLVHTVLNQPRTRSYETISYCWGDASKRAIILLDGYQVDVPASAAAALRCMRQESAPRILWIDSVCILQSHPNERSHQVLLMAEIYRAGVGNLVYAGEATYRTRRALETVEAMIGDIDPNSGDQGALRQYIQSWPAVENWDETRKYPIIAEGHGESDYYGLAYTLFDSEWFSRLWVLQEAVLSRSSTIFYGNPRYHGGCCVPLFPLLKFAAWLQPQDKKFWYIRDQVEGPSELWHLIFGEEGLRKPQIYMRELLSCAARRPATEPNDKVFGVLGLLSKDWKGCLPPEPELIQIDYAKSFSDTLTDATRYAIQQEAGLEILQCTNTRERYTDHANEDYIFRLERPRFSGPSWASRLYQFTSLKGDNVFERPHNFGSAKNTKCIETELSIRTTGRNTLVLSGYRICSILKRAVHGTSMKHDRSSSMTYWLREAATLVKAMSPEEKSWWPGDEYQDVEPPLEVIRTLFEEPTGDFGPGEARKRLEMLRTECIRQGMNKSSSEEVRNFQVSDPECIRYRNGSFFVGTGGHIGTAPDEADPDDIAVVLFGSRVPLILRPLNDGTFLLMGAAYVNGVMYGERIDEAERKGEEPEKFYIV